MVKLARYVLVGVLLRSDWSYKDRGVEDWHTTAMVVDQKISSISYAAAN